MPTHSASIEVKKPMEHQASSKIFYSLHNTATLTLKFLAYLSK